MAEALEAVLAALHLEGVHVVGYSLGARVALELCARPGQHSRLKEYFLPFSLQGCMPDLALYTCQHASCVIRTLCAKEGSKCELKEQDTSGC